MPQTNRKISGKSLFSFFFVLVEVCARSHIGDDWSPQEKKGHNIFVIQCVPEISREIFCLHFLDFEWLVGFSLGKWYESMCIYIQTCSMFFNDNGWNFYEIHWPKKDSSQDNILRTCKNHLNNAEN